MLIVLWFIGIALWMFNVVHVSGWIVFLWPLIPLAILFVLGMTGGIGMAAISVFFTGRRKRRLR